MKGLSWFVVKQRFELMTARVCGGDGGDSVGINRRAISQAKGRRLVASRPSERRLKTERNNGQKREGGG